MKLSASAPAADRSAETHEECMATLALAFVGNNRWNAEVYGVISATYSTADAMSGRSSSLSEESLPQIELNKDIASLNKRIDEFLDAVYASQNGPLPTGPSEFVNTERMEAAARSLRDVKRSIAQLYREAELKQLTSELATATSLEILKSKGDEIMEIAEWIEDVINSDKLKPQFDRAQEEFRRGETVDIRSLL